MSFADIAAAGPSKMTHTVANMDGCSAVVMKLEQYQRQVALITKHIAQPRRDDQKDVNDRIKYAMVLQEDVETGLSKLGEEHSIQKRKLTREFTELSRQLENAVKIVATREQERQDELRENTNISVEHDGEVLQFRQLEEEVTYNEVLIEERGKDIEEVHQSIAQVNEIFQDLASIVQDQQESIDGIETHIQESHTKTQQGLEQVQKAAANQQSCCIQ